MKEIQLTQGKVTLVDDKNYEWLNKYKWYANKASNETYYACTYLNGYVVYMHKLIMHTDEEVDHKDRNSLNNFEDNLRICTHRNNTRNKTTPEKGN